MMTYIDLVKRIFYEGHPKDDRTGTGSRSIFGHQLRFDLSRGFPILTTKRVFWRGVVAELLWFLRGETNVESLHEDGVTIWDEWADGDGELGPIYGRQWRRWRHRSESIDQIANVIEEIQTNPNSRRMIVSAWNVGEIENMALPPCHILFQFNVNPAAGTLSCQVYQRSADVFLGLPFNIASYALLTHIIAAKTGYKPGHLVHTLGDAHIYNNHVNQLIEQITRDPRELPRLVIERDIRDVPFEDLRVDDFELVGYDPHPAIKGEVSV